MALPDEGQVGGGHEKLMRDFCGVVGQADQAWDGHGTHRDHQVIKHQ